MLKLDLGFLTGLQLLFAAEGENGNADPFGGENRNVSRRRRGHGVLPTFYPELTTGLRRGEQTVLLWTDLDVNARTLSVSKSAGRLKGEVRATEPKTVNSVRTICLPKEAVDLLAQEHAGHPDNPCMFLSPVTGKMYGPDCVGRLHKTRLKKAEIMENLRFHGLRHTFATLAI